MASEPVVESVTRYLQRLVAQGIPVEYGVLFGSAVRGEMNEWSDIDVLVVSPHFDTRRRREDINLLWRTAAWTDSRIEPVAVGSQEYIHEAGSALLEMVRREGQIIPLMADEVAIK
jgi:predicted nucleotidyltransferase